MRLQHLPLTQTFSSNKLTGLAASSRARRNVSKVSNDARVHTSFTPDSLFPPKGLCFSLQAKYFLCWWALIFIAHLRARTVRMISGCSTGEGQLTRFPKLRTWRDISCCDLCVIRLFAKKNRGQISSNSSWERLLKCKREQLRGLNV